MCLRRWSNVAAQQQRCCCWRSRHLDDQKHHHFGGACGQKRCQLSENCITDICFLLLWVKRKHTVIRVGQFSKVSFEPPLKSIEFFMLISKMAFFIVKEKHPICTSSSKSGLFFGFLESFCWKKQFSDETLLQKVVFYLQFHVVWPLKSSKIHKAKIKVCRRENCASWVFVSE